MIQYTLKCADGHKFDSWFQSASAYEKLYGAGMISCSVCGCAKVEKAIMTPRVRPARKAAAKPEAEALKDPGTDAVQSMEKSPEKFLEQSLEKTLTDMRKSVEENSDYVGKNFVAEARAMHEGAAPERAIYGEARLDEAKALAEDGIPVAPLPFIPSRKTN